PGNHRHQEREPRGAGGRRIVKTPFAKRIAIGRAGISARLQTIEQGRSGAVDGRSETGAEWNIHRKNHILNLVRESPGGEHVAQGADENGLEIVARPPGRIARPLETEDILRRNTPPLTEIITRLTGIGSTLVDHHHRVDTLAPSRGVARRNDEQKSPKQPSGKKTVRTLKRLLQDRQARSR